MYNYQKKKVEIMTKTQIVTAVLLTFSLQLFSQEYETCNEIIEMTKKTIDHVENFFECDGKVCDGKKVSFFVDGTIQIKGNFINGKPYDTLYVFEGNKVNVRYYDTLNNKEWHLNEDGSVLYSISGIETAYYDKNRKKIKSVFESKPPATYRKWVVEYDENQNPKVKYSEENVSWYLQEKKIRKHIHNLDSVSNNVYAITFNDQNKTYFLIRKYYNEFPIKEKEIIQESIVAMFKNEADALFIYDSKKEKYCKLK